jgi:hypothetical protein
MVLEIKPFKAIEIYKADGDYPKFYRNFVGNSDNGRSSLRLANTFSLKINSIKLDDTRISAGDNVFLYLKLVAKHYYLLGEIGWLGCCLCHRYKFDGKILVKS